MYSFLAFLILSTAAFAQPVPAGDVVGVGNFIHSVSNLDKSIEFYHDLLGMSLQRAPTGPIPFLTAPEVPRLYNAVGAQYRVESAFVPESPMRAELVEFKDVDRRPVRPRVQDPGASIMILTVRDLAPIVARAKATGTKLLGHDKEAVLLSDPDGFFVELVEPHPTPPTKAPADSNLIDVSFAFVVSESSLVTQVFQEALGFQLQTGKFGGDRVLGSMKVRKTTTTVPGTNFQIQFLEFKNTEPKPVHSRLQDPGSAVLRLLVQDIGVSVRKLDASGVKIASAGGGVISLPAGGKNTLRAAITSAPDNLYIQLLQAPRP